MKLQELFIQNPWWEDETKIELDRHILNFKNSSFKWEPSVLNEMNLHDEGIYTLRGPRQIGKTTILKLLMYKLIKEENLPPQRILYLSLDNVSSKEELIDILISFSKFRRRTFPNGLLYIFLDEITMVHDWQYAIKYLWDIGILTNCFVLLTGSSAHDIQKSKERFPGRKGSGKDLVLYPATFSEFVETIKNARFQKYRLQEIIGLTEDEIKNIEFETSSVYDDFQLYMLTGGFPLIIDEFLKTGGNSERTLGIFRDVFLGEIERFGKRRVTLLQITKKLPEIMGRRISWQALKRSVDEVESIHTVIEYVETLALNYMIGIIFFLDINSKFIKPKKSKKLYSIDSIITRVMENITGEEIPPGFKVENVVYCHLVKLHPIESGLIHTEGPYFWYSDRGKEVDFIAGEEYTPIEVKYQNRIIPQDYQTMKRVFKKGILITKQTFLKDGNIVGLPLHSFLAIADFERNIEG